MAALKFLDGTAVRRWCGLATEALAAARERIDALNVFPVADSDTGTNLHLTMLAALKALEGLPESASQEQVWQALARGVLLGAQGNSGVITSQYLRGFAEVCGPASPCDGAVFRKALAHAARLSRAAVGEPVEGTMLTVASEVARSAAASGDGLGAVVRAAAEAAQEALARTTAQLDVLARAGVVDAGAAGLCVLFDTLAAVVTGSLPNWHETGLPVIRAMPVGGRPHAPVSHAPAGHPLSVHAVHGHALDGHGGGPAGGSPGYEVMYLLEAADEPVARLRERLGVLGDSLVVVGGEGLWNVHIHSGDPGAAIEAGIAVGRPYRIRVTYLGAPGQAISAQAAASKEHVVVAVAGGQELATLLEDAGAVVIRRGHDRMPEHAELLGALHDAVRREALAGAEEAGSALAVAILPGDPAVAALAETVAAQAHDEGIVAAVLPARAAVQSLSALAAHDPASAFEDDVAAMTDSALATRCGQVKWAPAAKRAEGFAGDDEVTSGADATAVAVHLVDVMLSDGGDLVTLLAGASQGPDAPAGREVAARVAAHLYASRPDVEVITHEGGEDGYLLMAGVE
ncbi:MAG: DAK2 domain-containing protein [Micromonosporaceae bacterium]